MPSIEKKSRSELTGIINNFIDDKRLKNKDGTVASKTHISVLEFIDRFQLLPYGLYPVQRFIVKLYYNIPLDDKEKLIRVSDKLNTKTLYHFTEKEYLTYLFDQGRCNIKEQDGRQRNELLLVLGRRSGKSLLSAIFAAYELYKILSLGNPQDYYGLSPSNEIMVLCLANDKDQAAIVYNEMSGYVEQTDFFKASRANYTQTFFKFRTEGDRKRYGDKGKSTIRATFKSSIAKGLRGRGTILLILDEIAFFVNDGKCARLFSIISTKSGPVSLDDILITNHVDRTKTGWTNIKPIGIVQEGGRPAIATRIYYGGVQKTKIVTTKSKYSIEPTPEHRIKFISSYGNIGWKYVRDLRVGDFIGINRETKIWPEFYHDVSDEASGILPTRLHRTPFPKFVDADFGEFLGILVGDGTWRAGKCRSLVQVTGGCEQFRPIVESHFSRYLGDFHLRRKSPHEHNTCAISPWSVVKNSLPFRTFLDRMGYRLNVTKSTKSVPWVILKSPKNVVAAFLRGLFETDGGLEQGGRTISFATASKKLAGEVQLLLLNFGITSSVYWKKNKNYPDRFYFYLRISGHESRRIFHEEIGFITERKNSLLVQGIGFGRDASNVIPHQYDRLRRILESVPIGSAQIKGDDSRTRITRLCSSSADPKRRSSISYDSARRLVKLGREVGADQVSLDELDHICQTNYFWDPVVSIEESEGEVADLFVPDGHEYVAQGMTNHNSSAEGVYRAVNPSIAGFSPKDPNNKHVPLGPTDGKVVAISSPDSKEGFFYNQYLTSLGNSPASQNMLMIQAPTWEVNPTLDKSYYETEYHKDAARFMTEHGALFSDRVRGWIEDSTDLTRCINTELRPATRGMPREPHFGGFDLGLSKDGSSIALTRIHQGKIQLAYHEVWYARRSWKESNPHLEAPMVEYAWKLQDVARLDLSMIAEWIEALSKRFYIMQGLFDQYSGIVCEQEFHKHGLKQFTMRQFSAMDSSNMFQAIKMLMYTDRLEVYDHPLAISSTEEEALIKKHSPIITELLELQAVSGGKNIITVEAPQVPGKHDDQSDAFARAVLLATEFLKDNPNISSSAQYISHENNSKPIYGYNQYHRNRQRLHGQVRERTVPKMNKLMR